MKTQRGELNIQSGTILKYRGQDEELTLPKNIVRIAPYAFADCTTLKKVVAPVRLASIGKGAFFGCNNLAEVTIPGRLFRRVNGGKVFPANARIFFRFYASSGAQSEDEDYSDGFGSEEEYLASGVNDIEKAFESEAQPQEAVSLAESPAYSKPYEDKYGVGNDAPDERTDALTPPDFDYGYDSELRRDSLVNLRDYLIVDDEVIKYIGAGRQTRVPDFITKIGENAFSNRDVEVVILPPKLKLVGKNAFSWCEHLTQIDLPDSVQMIDDGAFSNCSKLERVRLSADLKFLGANAFRACGSLKELVLPETLHTISRRAFDTCVALEKINVPHGIMRLAEGVFSHCESLRKIILPENLTEIGAWAFEECYELSEINFPPFMQSIGDAAFINCRSLAALDLPKSLKNIGRQAFVGCTSLYSVNAPAQIEKQVKHAKAFHKLSKLTVNYCGDGIN